MPVHLDTHDPDVELTPGTTKSELVAFLYRHPEYGYRPSELGDRLNIPQGTATATLMRLHNQEYIGKTDDSYYHALAHREDLRRYVASLDQLDRLFDQPTGETDDPSTARDIDRDAAKNLDEASLDAELNDLEDDLDQ